MDVTLRERFKTEEDGDTTLFFDVLADGEEAGSCSLRLCDEEAGRFGGHAGYFVREEYRRRHVAKTALLSLFDVARSNGLKSLYVACEEGNEASLRTALSAGALYVCTEPLPEDCEAYRNGLVTQVLCRVDLTGGKQ